MEENLFLLHLDEERQLTIRVKQTESKAFERIARGIELGRDDSGEPSELKFDLNSEWISNARLFPAMACSPTECSPLRIDGMPVYMLVLGLPEAIRKFYLADPLETGKPPPNDVPIVPPPA